MPITLTSTQKFQKDVNSIITQIASAINPNSSQGFSTIYNRLYITVFQYPNQTPAEVVAQLSTNAASVFAFLAAFNTFLISQGITDLDALPAYTANIDGTVTLTA